jgi:hypothetical protein
VIATTTFSHGLALSKRLLLVLAVIGLSLITVGAVVVLQQLAIVTSVLLILIAVAAWRPRYGLYAVVTLTMFFEPKEESVVMYWGYHWEYTISKWSDFQFLIFSPLELVLIAATLSVLLGALVQRRPLQLPEMWWLIAGFLVLIAFSLMYGISAGGDYNIGLWEVRSLCVAGLVALLTPSVLTRREHVLHLIKLIAFAAVFLAIEVIWRRYFVIELSREGRVPDLAYEHETPIILNFVIMLFVARLVWPASGRERLCILLVPLLLYAEMVTERRAGWIGLDMGFVLIAIFVFRLKRKVFFFVVLPLMILYMGYLGAFWNASGPLAQPARAVKSVVSPDPRDEQSNNYRYIETANVRLNIHANPITGLGFGSEYVFYYSMPDLSFWPFWHYIPHNTFLWVWMKMGSFGILAFLMICGSGLVRGVQLLKRANDDRAAPALVALVSCLLMLVVYSYVDVALTNVRADLLLGFVLGAIGMWGRSMAQGERS